MDQEINKVSSKLLKLRKITLTISVIDIIFCLISLILYIVLLFIGAFDAPEYAAGWIIFIMPAYFGIIMFSFFPDILCFIFSIIKPRNNNEKSNVMLRIIFSGIGFVGMTTDFMHSFLHPPIIIIYLILKVVLIISNIIFFIAINNENKKNLQM